MRDVLRNLARAVLARLGPTDAMINHLARELAWREETTRLERAHDLAVQHWRTIATDVLLEVLEAHDDST